MGNNHYVMQWIQRTSLSGCNRSPAAGSRQGLYPEARQPRGVETRKQLQGGNARPDENVAHFGVTPPDY
jgi:hypothetical protein